MDAVPAAGGAAPTAASAAVIVVFRERIKIKIKEGAPQVGTDVRRYCCAGL